MIRIPAEFEEHFRSKGWFPGRRVAMSKKVCRIIPDRHPALGVLSELSGIEISRVGRGEECATTGMVFGALTDQMDEVATWNALLHTTLVGLADLDSGHAELYMDAKGRCYYLSLIHDAFGFIGDDFENSLRTLLVGMRVRPMLRPDQPSVSLYGIEYDADSPEIYDY